MVWPKPSLPSCAASCNHCKRLNWSLTLSLSAFVLTRAYEYERASHALKWVAWHHLSCSLSLSLCKHTYRRLSSDHQVYLPTIGQHLLREEVATAAPAPEHERKRSLSIPASPDISGMCILLPDSTLQGCEYTMVWYGMAEGLNRRGDIYIYIYIYIYSYIDGYI